MVCKGESSHAFSLDECVEEANVSDHITCLKTSVQVPLQQVAPDVVMGDLDEQFVIDESQLSLQESRDCLLGDGGFGAVYRAKYAGKTVAVKVSFAVLHLYLAILHLK